MNMEITKLKEEVERLKQAIEDYLNSIPRNEDQGENSFTIVVEGGCVQDVIGLPDNWTYDLDDRDPV